VSAKATDWLASRRVFVGEGTPFGMKLTEGRSASFHAAGSTVLKELVQNILKEEEAWRDRCSTAPCIE
jgi:hypothetical protein